MSSPASQPTLRARIIDATVACLDECGYGATSIGNVQKRAGVSRGALTHHFPTREDLIAAVAERLLGHALAPVRDRRLGEGATPTLKALILDAWARIVNTREGRAFIEILIAARTDRALDDRLAPLLRNWNDEIGAAFARVFDAPEGDAAQIWAICRTFLRGLVIHERFARDPAERTAMVERFAGIVAPHLRLRPPGRR